MNARVSVVITAEESEYELKAWLLRAYKDGAYVPITLAGEEVLMKVTLYESSNGVVLCKLQSS